MGNFKKPYPSRGGDRDNSYGKSRDEHRGGGRDFGERPQMHPAICSQCGKKCEVPFRPSGEKPVYCRDCFNTPRTGGGAPSHSSAPAPYSQPRNDSGSNEEMKKQMAMLQSKLDKILQAVETMAYTVTALQAKGTMKPTASAPAATPAPAKATKKAAKKAPTKKKK